MRRTFTPHDELRPVELHILLSLAVAAQHGYAIRQEVERRSYGRVKLEPGTLYRALRRLLEAGLIEERPPAPGDDERRRTYALTDHGRRAALAEADRLSRLADETRRMLWKA
jgi:DNA-binding PadR family transcriptional regulator